MTYLIIFIIQSLLIPCTITCMSTIDAYADMYPLHSAIVNNDQKAFKKALCNKANINKKDGGGLTPLHVAIQTNRPWFCKRLIRMPNLKYDISVLETGIEDFEAFMDNASSIQKLIQFSPKLFSLSDYYPIFRKLLFMAHPNAGLSNENRTDLQHIFEDLLNAGIDTDNMSYENYESLFALLNNNISDTFSNNMLISLVKAGYSLIDDDMLKKTPIEYAWNNNKALVAELFDHGSPSVRIKVTDEDNNNKWVEVIPEDYIAFFKIKDAEKLSDTKSRLMTTNTARFIKNQQLGKRAVSRNLRINKNVHLQKKADFDNAVHELANIEID